MLDSNTLGSSPAAERKTQIDPRSNKAKKYTDVLEASDLRDSDTARSNQVSNSFFFFSIPDLIPRTVIRTKFRTHLFVVVDKS